MLSTICFNLDQSKILPSGNGHFNSKGHIMAVGDAHVFRGFVTPATDYFSHMPLQR